MKDAFYITFKNLEVVVSFVAAVINTQFAFEGKSNVDPLGPGSPTTPIEITALYGNQLFIATLVFHPSMFGLPDIVK